MDLMEVKIENDSLVIDLYDFIRKLTTEQKLEVADTLSIGEDIVKCVGDQIVDGFTEMVSSGARSVPAESTPHHALDVAIRRVAKNAGDVAAREIERLTTDLKYQEERVKELRKQLRDQEVLY